MDIESISDNCIRTLPAGSYIIGDLCYFVPDEIYDQIVLYGDEGSRVVTYLLGSHPVEMFVYYHGTAYGDGEYFDQSGKSYPVSAGLIGCVRIDNLPSSIYKYVVENANDCSHMCDFNSDFNVHYDDGVFNFGNQVIINTGMTSDDEDGFDDGYLEEDADEDDWDDLDDWDTR